MIIGSAPVLVTPPAGPLVPVADLRAHLLIDHQDDNAQLVEFEAAAVRYLDGYGGVMGRAILPQVWQQDFPAWGYLRLAMPDLRTATVTWLDDAGDYQPADATEPGEDAAGPYVRADGPRTRRVRVTYEVGMPDDALPVMRQAVRMMVAAFHANREDAGLPMSVQALINPLRRVRV